MEYFTCVDQHGSIAAAARRLHVSTAAISAALDTLEAQTGLALFERFPAKGLVLTGIGAAFLEQARTVLHEASALQAKAQELANPERGEVRFACYHALALNFGAEILRDHKAEWPRVSVSLIEGDIPKLRDLVRDGQVDVMLCYKDIVAHSGMQVRKLMDVAPKVILPATHPLAGQQRVRVKDLQGLPFVKVDEPDSGPSYLDMICAAGYVPRVAQVVRSYELARSCVGAGMGFTLLALTPRNTESYLGDRLVALPIEEDVGHFTIELAWRESKADSAVLRRFCELCERVVLA